MLNFLVAFLGVPVIAVRELCRQSLALLSRIFEFTICFASMPGFSSPRSVKNLIVSSKMMVSPPFCGQALHNLEICLDRRCDRLLRRIGDVFFNSLLHDLGIGVNHSESLQGLCDIGCRYPSFLLSQAELAQIPIPLMLNNPPVSII